MVENNHRNDNYVMVSGANYQENGDHITIYKLIKLTCTTLNLHATVYVKYISIKKIVEKICLGSKEGQSMKANTS